MRHSKTHKRRGHSRSRRPARHVAPPLAPNTLGSLAAAPPPDEDDEDQDAQAPPPDGAPEPDEEEDQAQAQGQAPPPAPMPQGMPPTLGALAGRRRRR